MRNIKEKWDSHKAEFGRKCYLDRSNVARIEMGRANLTFYNLVKIARALDMTVSELVKDFEEK